MHHIQFLLLIVASTIAEARPADDTQEIMECKRKCRWEYLPLWINTWRKCTADCYAGNPGLIYYGWKVDSSKPPFFLDTTQQLFNHNKHLGGIDVDKPRFSQFHTETMVSDDYVELAQEINARIKVEGSYNAFSAAAKASYESSSFSKHRVTRLDAVTEVRMVSNQLKYTPNIFTTLTDGAQALLKAEEWADFYKEFGAFYAKRLNLGGTLTVTTVTERHESETKADISAELRAKYGNDLMGSVSGTASGAVKNSKREGGYRMQSSWTLLGGKTHTAMGLTMQSNEEKAKTLEAWGKTMEEDNAVPVSFDIRPIWELLENEDAEKMEKLRLYITAQWKKNPSERPPYDPYGIPNGTYQIKVAQSSPHAGKAKGWALSAFPNTDLYRSSASYYARAHDPNPSWNSKWIIEKIKNTYKIRLAPGSPNAGIANGWYLGAFQFQKDDYAQDHRNGVSFYACVHKPLDPWISEWEIVDGSKDGTYQIKLAMSSPNAGYLAGYVLSAYGEGPDYDVITKYQVKALVHSPHESQKDWLSEWNIEPVAP